MPGQMQGTVTSWKSGRGFGFIECEGTEYFCHVSALETRGGLTEGKEVYFDAEEGRDGKWAARNVSGPAVYAEDYDGGYGGGYGGGRGGGGRGGGGGGGGGMFGRGRSGGGSAPPSAATIAKRKEAAADGRRIIVGNLSFQVNWQALKDHFRAIGDVLHADIFSDYSGRSKGMGAVEFASSADARRAIEQLDGTDLQGRNIWVREDRDTH